MGGNVGFLRRLSQNRQRRRPMPFRPYVVKTADVVFFRESRTGYNILVVIMAEMCKTLQHCAHCTLKNGPADAQLL